MTTWQEKRYHKIKKTAEEHPEWQIKDIAKALGYTYSSVYHLMAKYGFELEVRMHTYTSWTDDEKLDMLQMYVEGKTIDEICDYWNCHRVTLRCILKRFGVIKPSTRWDLMKERQLAMLLKAGKSQTEIAQLINIGYKAVKSKVYAIRIKYKTKDNDKLIEIISDKIKNYAQDQNQKTE